MLIIITSSVIGIANHNASAPKITGRSIMHAPLMIAISVIQVGNPVTKILPNLCANRVGFTKRKVFFYVSETVESISGSGTLTLHNDYMPVVPVITTTAETTLRWTVDGESFHKTVSTGTWEIPELELRYGGNSVSVTSEGTTTFIYRQGRL